MEHLHNIAVFGLPIMGTFIIGFVIGKYHERVMWNKLIETGKIPRPK